MSPDAAPVPARSQRSCEYPSGEVGDQSQQSENRQTRPEKRKPSPAIRQRTHQQVESSGRQRIDTEEPPHPLHRSPIVRFQASQKGDQHLGVDGGQQQRSKQSGDGPAVAKPTHGWRKCRVRELILASEGRR